MGCRTQAVAGDDAVMVMDALLGLPSSTMAGISPCRSGAAAAQQCPVPVLMGIPGRKAEARPGEAVSPKPRAPESCCVQAHARETKIKGRSWGKETGGCCEQQRWGCACSGVTRAVLSVG